MESSMNSVDTGLKMQNSQQTTNNPNNNNKPQTPTTPNICSTSNPKHFKKSMIVEYETNAMVDDCSSTCSTSSHFSSTPAANHANANQNSSNLALNTSDSQVHCSQSIQQTASKPMVHSFAQLMNSIKKEEPLDTASSRKRKLDHGDDVNNDGEERRVVKEEPVDDGKRAKHEKGSPPSVLKKKKKSKDKKSKKEKKSKQANANKSKKSSSTSTASTKQKLYCICKSADSKRFMIACDNCDEWYHGDCVGVTQSLSNKIKVFFCHLCRNEKPSLKIKYKSKYQEYTRQPDFLSAKTSGQHASDSSFGKFQRETQLRIKKESELLSNKHKHGHKSASSSKSSSSAITNTKSFQSTNESENSEQKGRAENTSSTTHHSDENTFSTSYTDYQLNTSSSNRVYGKSNVSSEDIENFLSAMTMLSNEAVAAAQLATDANVLNSMKNEPNIPTATSKTAQSHKQQKNKGGRRVSREKSDLSSSSSKNSENEEGEEEEEEEETASSEESVNSSEMDDSEEDDNNEDEAQSGSDSSLEDEDDVRSPSQSKKNTKKRKLSTSNSKRENKKAKKNNSKKSSPKKGSKPSSKKSNKLSKQVKSSSSNKSANTKKSGVVKKDQQSSSAVKLKRGSNARQKSNIGSEQEKSLVKSSENSKKLGKKVEMKQCLGPECIQLASANSKYCSIECGMKLARERLIFYLKSRYEEYNKMPSYADQLNLKELERINVEIDLIKSKLSELEQRHVELDLLIERTKFKTINPNVERDRDKSYESNETEIYCVTCGLVCGEKHALKHMEKCFNKIESQAFFGSFYKTHIEGRPIFCDYFNAQTKMYCKRLKVMCPEHEKERKIGDDEVCGYPLPRSDNLLVDSENEICLASKRNCSLHFKWEKLRRAQIDLEKLRSWLKLEELLEQKRAQDNALIQRGGLLSIMLNETLTHSVNTAMTTTTTTTTTTTSTTTTTTTSNSTANDLMIAQNA